MAMLGMEDYIVEALDAEWIDIEVEERDLIFGHASLMPN